MDDDPISELRNFSYKPAWPPAVVPRADSEPLRRFLGVDALADDEVLLRYLGRTPGGQCGRCGGEGAIPVPGQVARDGTPMKELCPVCRGTGEPPEPERTGNR